MQRSFLSSSARDLAGASSATTSLSLNQYDHGTFFGAGFDLNRSWVLGKNDNFYVGVGLGLKRMYVSADATFDLKYIPTFRIINVAMVF